MTHPEGDRLTCPSCGWAVEMRGGEREERAEFLYRKALEHVAERHPESLVVLEEPVTLGKHKT